MTDGDKPLVVLVVSILGVIATILLLSFRQAQIEKACLQYGYPDSKMTFLLDGYCIVRIDQTDHVLPLADAERKPR